jgi:hypothetical protein
MREKEFKKITVEELKEFLKTVKHYRRVELLTTTPLKPKMVVKDRKTKEPNPLLNGYVKTLLNVASLGTTKEGTTAYRVRSENNGHGAEESAFKGTYVTYISPVLAKHKTKEQYYFSYEVKLNDDDGKVENVNVKEKTYLLPDFTKFAGKIGDVWNKVSKNPRGVDMRRVKLENINRISIDNHRFQIIDSVNAI